MPKLRITMAVTLLTALVGVGAAAPTTLSTTTALDAPVWLCKPGQPGDACGQDAQGRLTSPAAGVYPGGGAVPLDTTLAVDGTTAVVDAPSTTPPVDCFFAYPTVDVVPNPVLQVGALPPSAQPQEVAVTLAQVEQLAGVCRLFVPLYRQSTLVQLAGSAVLGTDAYPGPGFADVQQAWDDYWANDNVDPTTGMRRGVIVLGHSQGSVAVEKVLQSSVDGNAAATRQLVSAVILGGQVQVPLGATDGGGADADSTFQQLPLCTPTARGVPIGCVVAYSSYAPGAGSAPPSGSLAANLAPGHQIACVDPAALLRSASSGTSESLDPVLPTRTLVQGNALNPNGDLAIVLAGITLPTDATGYREQPGALTGRCAFSGDATANSSWLDIGDPAGILPDTSGSALGLHVVDYNVALGNLRTLLAAQAATWIRTQEGSTR